MAYTIFCPLASDGWNFSKKVKSENVREIRETFTASLRERSMIVLMYWKSCGTHRSAVVCEELWEWRSYCSPNQNSKVAEAATRLRCSADSNSHLFLHVGSAER